MLKKNFQILIVEDDLSLSEILQEIFMGFGCKAEICANGVEAMEHLKSKKFNLVISDVKMPQMSGMSLLDAINQQHLNIPVILMTGYSEYKEEDVYNKGGVVLLEKPFSKDKVKELYETYIKLLMIA